jgi:ATP-dependent helicase/nuclease subunit B
MSRIGKNDPPNDPPIGHIGPLPLDHPAVVLWARPVHGLLPRIQAAMLARGAHPARTLVLLPYAQLLPLAARLWAQCYPDGFAPQFETTQNWSTRRGGCVPGATDLALDMALDTLTAQAMLRTAGLGAQQDALAGLLVQAAHQLAPLAAACPPPDRAQWAHGARSAAVLGMESTALALEAAVARIAVEWAAQSDYASDVLFDDEVQTDIDCLLVVQGFAANPMLPALQAVWGARMQNLALAAHDLGDEGLGEPVLAGGGVLTDAQPPAIAWHACLDAEDEAQRSAACAVQHIAAGRYPLALVSSDRALTRRVRAMLESVGVQIRDETGWKLSTSHAGAVVMGTLKAAVWNASGDVVLGWLKGSPVLASALPALETALRRDQARDWRGAGMGAALKKSAMATQAYGQVNALREPLQGSHTLVEWLERLRATLQTSGVWEGLQTDGAGQAVVAALRLTESPLPAWSSLLTQALWSARRMDLAEFTAWANQALEGASFSPPYPAHEQVVFLPMSQMLARPFAALVLAGCDEVRLPPAPEPPGGWTAAQRAALGLPSREELQAVTLAAWQHALQTPYCDVLWRCSDDTGETVLPSALVQLAQAAPMAHAQAVDPRVVRTLVCAPVQRPEPQGHLLSITQLSASAYDDLRTCPYRFFAMRQLGLRPVDELDASVDKRDFGLWLHDVLRRFHETWAALERPDTADPLALLQAAADATTASMGLMEGEFLPFAAAWPAVRDGYLRWLPKHASSGAAFASAETAHTQPLGAVQLVGRIDRIDRLADGNTLVLDYKTENASRTAQRIKEPLEDTQMAFYAALLPDDTVQGAYVNLGEREGTKDYYQAALDEARDALIAGILDDLGRIGQGEPMPALGEGSACDFCQARGLCRKDFWRAA